MGKVCWLPSTSRRPETVVLHKTANIFDEVANIDLLVRAWVGNPMTL